VLASLVAVAVVGPLGAEETAAPDEASRARAMLGAPRAQPLSGAALDRETQEVASLLRCPVCQGLSVADSPTDLARDMKRQARELLTAGYDREQVLAYFESSYGEFVRLEPPLRGVNWLVWIAPLAGLLAGGYVVARSLRRPRAAPFASEEKAPDAADDPELGPYVLRVRELAYGWPGGRRPAEGGGSLRGPR
jgi:cytochrome c-type biogenesis protein CcmH